MVYLQLVKQQVIDFGNIFSLSTKAYFFSLSKVSICISVLWSTLGKGTFAVKPWCKRTCLNEGLNEGIKQKEHMRVKIKYCPSLVGVQAVTENRTNRPLIRRLIEEKTKQDLSIMCRSHKFPFRKIYSKGHGYT